MVFVNIFVFCNQRTQTENRKLRPTHKYNKISHLEQFLVLYHSIKKNWTFPHRISLCHSVDFSENNLDALLELELDLFKVEPDIAIYDGSATLTDSYSIPYTKYCRAACFYVVPKVAGTHRLVLDVDMIALKNPVFDYNVDFQAMYSRKIPPYTNQQIKTICDRFSFRYRDYTPEPLLAKYIAGKTNIQPYFNGGAILIKESLSKLFGELWRPSLITPLLKELWGNSSRLAYLSSELTLSLALLTISQNWKPFELGFNYWKQTWEIPKENISLYHYISGPTYAQRHFNSYFNVVEKLRTKMSRHSVL